MRIFAVLFALAACGDNAPPLVEVASFPAVPNHTFDLLLLVDDSTNADMITNLKNSLEALTAVLGTLDPPTYDLHLGVATSDMGTTGSSAPDSPAPSIGSGAGSCSGKGKDGRLTIGQATQISGTFLVDQMAMDGTRTTNYSGDLHAALSGMLSIGAGGCGFEQHLRGMQRALSSNAGFLRDEANLGVILVADEDDCSVRDPAFFTTDTSTLGPLQSFRCTNQGIVCNEGLDTVGEKSHCRPREDSAYVDGVRSYIEFLRSLRDPRRIMVATLTGPAEPFSVALRAPPGGMTPILALGHSCQYVGAFGPDVADPAVRDEAFAIAFPNHAVTTICQQDLRPSLAQIAQAIKKTLGDPCVEVVDVSTCVVEDVHGDLSTSKIPACDNASGDCYRFASDPRVCPATTGNLRIEIVRSTPPAADTWTHVRCQL